ncbi:MAG: molybdenum cofactor guanylyltransferase [Chloroflexi bacterium]|nr:molybdenum cofactor guanylyltransferase [Chloroflexota bacterium]
MLNTRDAVAVVLAGGEARRMGAPKAFLRYQGRPFIELVVETLRPLFREVVVVAREQGSFRGLSVRVVLDAYQARGPLVGLWSGLRAINSPWCFLAGCDMPLIQPAVVSFLARRATDTRDIVAPVVGGRLQTLHAFYSQRCLPAAEALLAEGVTSLFALTERQRTLRVSERQVRAVDPGLLSFRDIDTPEELEALRHVSPAQT